jgi:hypothetical protein
VFYQLIYVIFFSPVIIGSCVSTFEPAEPLVPVDYSFPITGKNIETALIHSTIDYSWKEKRNTPNDGIILTGQL